MPKLVSVALIVAAMVALWVWWIFLARKRLIQDTPTSASKGVALGLNELIGTVGVSELAPSPQSGVECVWWKNEFFRKDSEGRWKKTGKREGGPVSFQLEDESGAIAVRPRNAQVSGTTVYEGPALNNGLANDPAPTLASRYIAGRASGTRTKVVEQVVRAGDQVYVLGTAQLRDESLDVYIGPDADGSDPFLISVGSESDAVLAERMGVAVGFIAALVAAAGAGVALADGQAIKAGGFQWTDVDLVPPALGILIVLMVMTGASVVFIYNGLMRLRQRAQAAWSLIDVQLRRRQDLIPNLVEVVKAHGSHEASVQASIAQLRSSLVDTLGAKPSDDAVRSADAEITAESVALGRLMALAEAYPTLNADESFRALRVSLVDTEDRVALAREFYNNSVQALHDRAGVLPGAAVAWVFELDLSARFLSAEQLGDQAEVGVGASSGT